MRLRTRLLRIGVILLGVFAFAGFFAFSTFLYSPFEGDLEADVAVLVPRDVDFFVAKADLGRAFEKFPHLAIEKRLQKHPAWQAFASSPEGQALAREWKVEETLASLEAQVAGLPLGKEPLELFGGEDLALAGYFRGRSLEQADWAVYGRTSWMGRLGAALLRHPGLIGLEKQGIKATLAEGHVALSGGGLPREVFVGRILDVVIVATKPELVQAAIDLQANAYADSFYQSANYNDWVKNVSRSAKRDEFEVYVNTRKLLENLKLAGPWPNTKSQDFTPAFLGRLFQLPSLKNAMGVIGLDDGLQVDLHGDFSSELISPEQDRIYRKDGFDRKDFEEAARLAPRDTGLFCYLHAPAGDLLRMVFASVEPALKKNVEDVFRNTGRYQNIEQLIGDLDQAFKDRVALIVRPNDYPPGKESPPNNGDPVPAIAVVLWTQDQGRVDAFRDHIGNHPTQFALKGRQPNEAGYYSYSEAGYKTYEFWNEFIPGTGVIVTSKAGEMTVITNSIGMMGHLLKTFQVGGDKYPRLSDEPRFTALVQSSIPNANFGAWANPRTVTPVLRQSAQRFAKQQIKVDYKSLRPPEEAKVLREEFGGRRAEVLTEEERARLDELVDARLKKMKQTVEAEQLPAIMARQERMLSYMDAVTGALVMLKLDPKSFDFSARIVAPVDAPAAP